MVLDLQSIGRNKLQVLFKSDNPKSQANNNNTIKEQAGLYSVFTLLSFQAIREMEERLMASAFYDLSMKMHRGAVEDRLKNLSQGQSFLARQRQVNTRKGVYNGGQGPEYFSNYE